MSATRKFRDDRDCGSGEILHVDYDLSCAYWDSGVMHRARIDDLDDYCEGLMEGGWTEMCDSQFGKSVAQILEDEGRKIELFYNGFMMDNAHKDLSSWVKERNMLDSVLNM